MTPRELSLPMRERELKPYGKRRSQPHIRVAPHAGA